jgi:hypothetical protein
MGYLWILVIFAIPALFFIAAFVVGCFEKQMVRSFEREQLESLSAYGTAMAQRAGTYGFEYRDSGVHPKHKKVKGILLLSHDALILAIVSEGEIAKMPLKKTVLYSRFADGSVLITLDEAGISELDPLTRRQFLMNADFPELVRKHREALAASRVAARPFPADASWIDLDELNRARTDRVVAAGLARYVDAGREQYRLTVWASFKTTILHGTGQVLSPKNYVRSSKKRPG